MLHEWVVGSEVAADDEARTSKLLEGSAHGRKYILWVMETLGVLGFENLKLNTREISNRRLAAVIAADEQVSCQT